jgi:hypothetical protein
MMDFDKVAKDVILDHWAEIEGYDQLIPKIAAALREAWDEGRRSQEPSEYDCNHICSEDGCALKVKY